MRNSVKSEAAYMHNAKLVAYGQVGLPLAGISLPLYVYLPTFYSTSLGLSLTTVGLVLLAARIWDFLSDPLVGVLSDRIGEHKNRRKKWIIAGSPLFIAGLLLLFMPLRGAGATYLLVVSVIFYLGVTMVTIPYLAWGAELANGYHERSRVTGIRECFVIVGTLFAAAIPYLAGNDMRSAMQIFAISITLIFVPSVILLIITTQDPVAQNLSNWTWRSSLKTISQDESFRRLLFAYFLNGFANGLPATLFILFVSHKLGAPDEIGPLLILYFACGIFGIPGWLALSRRIDKHRAWSVAMLTACVCFISVHFLKQGDIFYFACICVLTGFCLGADLTLPPSIQADVIAQDSIKTGEDRAGTFFGLWNFATKLALAGAVGISFPLLEWSGFSAQVSNQTENGLLMLTLLYGGLPILFKVAAISLIWKHHIDRDGYNNGDNHEENFISHSPSLGASDRGMQ